MKTALLKNFNKIEICEVPIPDIGPTDILVKLEPAALIYRHIRGFTRIKHLKRKFAQLSTNDRAQGL